MQSGNYVLLQKSFSGQQYFVLSGGGLVDLDLKDGISTEELQYSLCETG